MSDYIHSLLLTGLSFITTAHKCNSPLLKYDRLALSTPVQAMPQTICDFTTKVVLILFYFFLHSIKPVSNFSYLNDEILYPIFTA